MIPHPDQLTAAQLDELARELADQRYEPDGITLSPRAAEQLREWQEQKLRKRAADLEAEVEAARHRDHLHTEWVSRASDRQGSDAETPEAVPGVDQGSTGG